MQQNAQITVNRPRPPQNNTQYKRRVPLKRKKSFFQKNFGLICFLSALLAVALCLSLYSLKPVTSEVGQKIDYSHITSSKLISLFCKVDADLSEINTASPAEIQIPIKLFGIFKANSKLRIVDTVSPKIEPQNVCITKGIEVTGDMFVKEATDKTKITYKIIAPEFNTQQELNKTVSITATDEGNNTTLFRANLIVIDPQNSLTFECGTPYESIENSVKTVLRNAQSLDFSKVQLNGSFMVTGKNTDTAFFAKINIKDTTPPVISGHQNISLDLGTPLTLSDNVQATDSFCGSVKVNVDSSAVNTKVAGTYQLVYTATDTSGNTAKEIVTVTVNKPSKLALDVKNILQKPALPNGCEVVSLAIALKYNGYTIDPVKLYDDFMPQSPLKAGDPWTTYVGNAKGTGYGCYAPCVVTTGNAYLASVGSSKLVYDVSGNTLDYYETLLESGTPVIMWGTLQMNGNAKICWEDTINGKDVNWHSYSHCLVLIGYTDKTYIFCDPLRGIVEYSKTSVEASFALNYRQACIIK